MRKVSAPSSFHELEMVNGCGPSPSSKSTNANCPGVWTRPAVFETDFDTENAAVEIMRQPFDLTNCLTSAADASDENVEGGCGAAGHQRGNHPADCMRPIRSAQQHHRVENKEQEDDREPAVGTKEPPIRDPFHRCQRDQCDADPEAPVSNSPRRSAQTAQ